MGDVLLDVPYYRQTRFATCGPAALMMVMKFWDADVVLSREVEFRLWRRARSLRYFGATLPGGLACAAVAEGFQVEFDQLFASNELGGKKSWLSVRDDRRFLDKAKRLGIVVRFGRDQMRVIRDALVRGIPPVVLVRLLPIIGENVLHWVVVSGVSNEGVFVNDPYVPLGGDGEDKKDVLLSFEVFEEALGTDKNRGFCLPPAILTIMN